MGNKPFHIFEEDYRAKMSFPIKGDFKKGDWVKLDLSKSNTEITPKTFKSVEKFSRYIQNTVKENNGKGAYGGYKENRKIYEKSDVFAGDSKHRSIHLGIDFWMEAGTPVQAPLPGLVHSFGNNSSSGDYGPTIILKHYFGNEVFHTLYGHLSESSLSQIKEGKLIKRKEIIGHLGSPSENVDWPPHLHFQIIKNMGDYRGDYPGVCMKTESEKYLRNSPDPLSIFGDPWKKILF